VLSKLESQSFAALSTPTQKDFKMPNKIRTFLCVSAAIAAAPSVCWAGLGPVAKWEDRTPDVSYFAQGNMFDMERCLMRTNGLGGNMFVYSQPDRPAERLLLWQSEGDATARIDLVAVDGKVKVTMWKAPLKNGPGIRKCFPDMP
jgi:hypothetical protein